MRQFAVETIGAKRLQCVKEEKIEIEFWWSDVEKIFLVHFLPPDTWHHKYWKNGAPAKYFKLNFCHEEADFFILFSFIPPLKFDLWRFDGCSGCDFGF